MSSLLIKCDQCSETLPIATFESREDIVVEGKTVYTLGLECPACGHYTPSVVEDDYIMELKEEHQKELERLRVTGEMSDELYSGRDKIKKAILELEEWLKDKVEYKEFLLSKGVRL